MKPQILKTVLIILVIFSAISCKKEVSYPWTIYNMENGLPENIVRTMTVDSSGNIWIGGPDFLSKFDGSSWMHFTSQYISGYINAIAFDKQKNIWIATAGGGVTKFDGANWITFNKNNSNILSNMVHALVIDDQNNKWLGTNFGICKFDGINWTTYTNIKFDITTIAIDHKNNIWFGSSDAGVYRFDGLNWTRYKKENGLADDFIYKIVIDSQDNKWFGTPNGVSKYDETNWTTYTISDGLAFNDINAIAIDANGNKWFGSRNTTAGVTRYDDSNCTYFNNDIINCGVNDICVDNYNNVWIATGYGIVKLEN